MKGDRIPNRCLDARSRILDTDDFRGGPSNADSIRATEPLAYIWTVVNQPAAIFARHRMDSVNLTD